MPSVSRCLVFQTKGENTHPQSWLCQILNRSGDRVLVTLRGNSGGSDTSNHHSLLSGSSPNRSVSYPDFNSKL